MFGFYKNYVMAKGSEVQASVLEALVNWDPDGAAAADIASREKVLDRIGTQLVQTRAKFNHQVSDLEPKQKRHSLQLAAAEDLQQQLEAADTPLARQSLSSSLQTLLGILEQESPEIDAAKTDIAETENWLREREAAYAQACEMLKTAKSRLERTVREMQRASEHRDREEQRTEEARVTAGLSQNTNKLDVALGAMERARDKATQAAEAAKLKREYLAPETLPTTDANIAAAMARASGADAEPKTTAERLAALQMSK